MFKPEALFFFAFLYVFYNQRHQEDKTSPKCFLIPLEQKDMAACNGTTSSHSINRDKESKGNQSKNKLKKINIKKCIHNLNAIGFGSSSSLSKPKPSPIPSPSPSSTPASISISRSNSINLSMFKSNSPTL